MKKLMAISVAVLITGFVCADLMAQRGGRGQGQQGNRNNQSTQQGQGRRGAGQNTTGQQPGGRDQAGQGGNTRGQGGASGQGQNGQRGNGQGQRGNGQGQRGNGQGQRGNGQGQGGNGRGQSNGGTLTAQERTELSMMREEEKLARDVYTALNQKWGATIFANIARAESKHMQAVAGLLSRYQIPDPVVSNTPGTFSQPRFQQLYQSLVNEGSASLTDAFKVGLKIEEMDIADLRNAIQSTSNNDIQRVFQHLEQGSRNHLRAFASQLRNAGGTYASTQLSQTEFDSIANSQPGRQGNQARGGGRQGQGNGQAGRRRGGAPGSGNNKGQGGKGRGR